MVNILELNDFNNFYKNLENLLKLNKLSTEFLISKEFIKKIVSFKDPVVFRLLMNLLENYTFIDIYEEAYDNKIINRLNTYDGRIFPEFKDLLDNLDLIKDPNYNTLKYKHLFTGKNYDLFCKFVIDKDVEGLSEFLWKINNQMYTDYICEYLFKDTFNNVIVDIKQILHYPTNLLTLSIEKCEFYKEVLSLELKHYTERLKFFNKYKDSNIVEIFYDDVSLLKEDSHKRITDSSIKLDESLIDINKSKKYGVKVYNYNGEPFRGIFRVTSLRADMPENIESHLFSTKNYGYSFSYADSEHFWLFSNPTEFMTLFYSDIDPNNIIHVNETDSFSDAIKYHSRVSLYPNELSTVDRLLNNRNGYNELVIKTNGYLKPTAIVLMDTGEEEKKLVKDLEKYKNLGLGPQLEFRLNLLRNGRENILYYAKMYDIPVMLINPKKYNTKYTGNIDDKEIGSINRLGNYLTDAYQVTDYYFTGRRF